MKLCIEAVKCWVQLMADAFMIWVYTPILYSIQSHRSVSEILVHISYKISCSNKVKGVKISCHEFNTYGVFPNVKQSLRN